MLVQKDNVIAPMNLNTKLLRLIPPATAQFLSRNQWRLPGMRRVFAFGAGLIRNQDGTIQHGVGKGLRFNIGLSHSAFMFGTHKPSLQKAIAQLVRPGMSVFDVGANVGYYAIICARLVGNTGRVLCFEPLLANADQIEYNSNLNGFVNLKVRREALGSTDGRTRFLQSAEPTWGNLESVGKLPDKYIGDIEVVVRRLDSVMIEANLAKPDLIKIDVEGAEVDVLRGASATIESARPVITLELHDTNAAVAEILDDVGYEAIVIDRKESIIDAPWNAYVLAVPRERRDQLEIIKKFSSSGLNVIR